MRKVLLALLVTLLPALALPESIYSYGCIQHQPAAGTKATISTTPPPSSRFVARHLTICVSAVTAQAPLIFNLRDGASGAGTILWSARLMAPAGAGMCLSADVDIIGSVNTAMTLESAAAPAASNFATVSLNGYNTY